MAKAAGVAATLDLRDLISDLLRARGRLLEKPVERDPLCWNKNARAKALLALDAANPLPISAERHGCRRSRCGRPCGYRIQPARHLPARPFRLLISAVKPF